MADDKVKSDFGGWATKYGVACTDGRTIKSGAFKHMDGTKVSLVWQHGHNDINNILGHAILHAREEGIYADGYFNETPGGQAGKQAVQHGDIVALSIYANKLVEKNKLVHGGEIRELSLVLSGANPGAFIENVSMTHGDDTFESEDEVVIYAGVPLDVEEVVTHADPPSSDGKTVADVIETMDDDQKKVMYALIAQAMDNSGDMSQSDSDEGENVMKKNVFDGSNDEAQGPTLTHAQLEEFATAVFADMPKHGSFKASFLAHAGTYGIDNISYLFPDAHLDDDPSFQTRRMDWVSGWLGATRHSPFSRLKKVWADLTEDTARAKGYITGNEKTEQVFGLLKRETAPQTVYKKQKLDRDDIIDVRDFNVVAWMWKEMRFMLNEEIARAALVGDGRSALSEDKINPDKIRPIYGDASLFVHYLTLESTVTDYLDIMDAIQVARVNYKGRGMPNFYTTNAVLTAMLLLRDTTDRRLYKSLAEVAAELRVAEIIEVEVLEGVERVDPTPVTGFTADLLGIMVNPSDYTYGTDKGGEITTFDQFDIDFNQNKYLIETRLSGSLLDPRTALVVERKQA